MIKCVRCGAYDHEYVYRKKKGEGWTRNMAFVKIDKTYNPHATIVYIGKDGYCHKCRFWKQHRNNK